MNKFAIKIGILIIVALTAGSLIFVSRAGIVGSSAGSQTLFEQFVISGGPIVWFILLPMSVVTMYLILNAALNLRKSKLLPKTAEADALAEIRTSSLFWHSSNGNTNILSEILRGSINGDLPDAETLTHRVSRNLEDKTSALMRKIEWLNIIGNISPMIGLFGTVFGMIKLFNAIVIAAGQPQPAQLAEGISIALVTTLWGLLIAIPALAFYGAMTNHIESVITQAAASAQRIIPELAGHLEEHGENTSDSYRAAISQFSARKKAQSEPLHGQQT